MNFHNPLAGSYRRLRANTHADPSRDWLTLLTLSILAFILIVVWNVWAFDTVASGGTIGKTATTTSATFNRTSVDTIRVIFEKRRSEEVKYVTGAYRYADPSQ